MNRRHFLYRVLGGLSGAMVLTVSSLDTTDAQDALVMDAPTAREQMRSGGLTLVDIRRPDEWKKTGIAEGAKAITMHDPKGPKAFLANLLSGVEGDRSAPIGLICATGVRSTFMQRFLTNNGFTNVYNVKEGMLGRGPTPGWIKRGLPVVPYPGLG